MTTLSTHDTKRSEDVRARLAVLAERPEEWATWVRDGTELATPVRAARSSTRSPSTCSGRRSSGRGRSARTGCRPTRSRRSARRSSTRVDRADAGYESAVVRFVSGVVDDAGDRGPRRGLGRLDGARDACQRPRPEAPPADDAGRARRLPGDRPRRPVARRPGQPAARRLRRARDRLARLDAGDAPADLADEKLLVTTAALRTRREWPEWFTGEDATYVPVATAPSTPSPSVAGRATTWRSCTVVHAARRPARRRGGFGDATLALPERRWSDVVSARTFDGGRTRLGDLVGDDGLPVALLVRVRDES